jgi:hypothetical protein
VKKPQRKLWELNNKHREVYGQPLLSEPEGGFADEERTPGFDEVSGWFRAATTAQPHRPRSPKVPDTGPVDRIARLVHEWRELIQRPSDPLSDAESEIAFDKAHNLQRAVDNLEKTLRPVLDLLVPGMMPGDPAVARLIDMWNALVLAKPYIGTPPTQGPPAPTWHTWARALETPVRQALASIGHGRASIKASGPLVKVICQALAAIDDDEHKPEAVETVLKRRRQRGAAII